MNLDTTLPLPTVAITLAAWQRLHAYVAICPVEINGFGLVQREGNSYLITEVFILKQTVTSGTADTVPDPLHRLTYHMVVNGIDPSQLCFQWHSHVHGRAYCSATDLQTIEDWKGDVLISLVANKYGDIFCRLDYFKPDRFGFIEVPLQIIVPPLVGDEFEGLQDEVLEQVSLPQQQRFLRRPRSRQLALPHPQPTFTVAPATQIKETAWTTPGSGTF